MISLPMASLRHFLLLISVLRPWPARSADRYVSTTGLDTNPGTLAMPYRTIQKAITAAGAGDTIHVRALKADGTQAVFSERLTFSGKSGTEGLPITLKSYAGDLLPDGKQAYAAVDQTGVTPPNSASALLWIQNSNYLTVEAMEFRNYTTTSAAKLPAGIYIVGACQNVKLLHNQVHHIWQNSTTTSGNAFGIAVYGTSSIDGLVLDGNEVHDLRTGQSECVALNGNVTNFTVRNNIVWQCNNIGIDFIGHEGTHITPSLDQARNGVCAENVLYEIDSSFNPGYGGDFTLGGGDASAPGLYVDGGANIVLERNTIHHCNIGISVASEQFGSTADNVTIRNNLLHHNHVGGIFLGGSDPVFNGGATAVSITNNTLYKNDEFFAGGGCISVQHYVSGTTIRQNIFVPSTDAFGWGQYLLNANTTGAFAAAAIDWNLYASPGPNNLEFIFNDLAYGTFATWKAGTGMDAHSLFVSGSVGFVNASGDDFTLIANSVARNAGDPAFLAASGETDWSGQSRVVGGRVDLGMDEYLDAWQAWRDLYFSLPEGGVGAEAGDDPDRDGASNLLEFSQGMNPLVADPQLLPSTSQAGSALRFSYRKAGSGLTYQVRQSSDLIHWTTSTAAEQTNGAGLFWIDVPQTGVLRLYFRLQITQP